MDAHNRRMTDIDKTQEIEALILEEEDKHIRTILLVVQSLNVGIREQTIEQRQFRIDFVEYQKRFDTHLQDYNNVINQGKGVKLALGWGMRILLGIFALLQVVIISIGAYFLDLSKLNLAQHTEFTARLIAVEKSIEKGGH